MGRYGECLVNPPNLMLSPSHQSDELGGSGSFDPEKLKPGRYRRSPSTSRRDSGAEKTSSRLGLSSAPQQR